MSQQARQFKYEREKTEFVVSAYYTIIAHDLLPVQERSFWRKCLIVMVREPNCDNARSIDFIMVALCNRADHYNFTLWFLSSIFFFFFSSPNLGGRRLDVYHTSTHGVALVRI